MKKGIGFIAGVVLASAVATLIVSRERAETRRLQNMMELLQSQRDGLAKVAEENARLSNSVAQAGGPSNEPSLEVLRLRGEVGRLRCELENAQHEKSRNVGKFDENGQTTASVPDQLAVNEIDLDGFMNNIPSSATTNDVLAELQRVGAQLVANEQEHIAAGISIPTTNADLSPSVLMQFYFEGDRLNSKQYMRLPR
jgi:hypothetical protein